MFLACVADLWNKEESTSDDLLHPMSLKVKSMCAGDKQCYATDGKRTVATTLPMADEVQPAPLSTNVFTVTQHDDS